jgi:chorismate--pyruvate lyase
VKSKQRWYRRHQLFNRSIPSPLVSWLFDTSSLTARLINLCGSGFSVRVISQHYQKLDSTEASAMALPQVDSALVREVVLCCNNQPLVYARTVIPVTTIKGSLRKYANMGNRPLGAMLFADRTMQREAVEVSVLPAAHNASQYTKSNDAIWGRRSVFRVSGKPLLVSEYFLPELLMRS